MAFEGFPISNHCSKASVCGWYVNTSWPSRVTMGTVAVGNTSYRITGLEIALTSAGDDRGPVFILFSPKITNRAAEWVATPYTVSDR